MLLVEVPMALLETTLGINTYKSLLDPLDSAACAQEVSLSQWQAPE
jgi:hypothetical protein